MLTTFFIYLIGSLFIVLELLYFLYKHELASAVTNLKLCLATDYVVYYGSVVYPILYCKHCPSISVPIQIQFNYVSTTIEYRSTSDLLTYFYSRPHKRIFLKDQLAQLYPEALL